MSIYHNNQHLAEDNESYRFLVDREGNLWTVILLFSRINPFLAGDFIFVASNEFGYDEASVRIHVEDDQKEEEEQEVISNEPKAPQLRETAPELIDLSEEGRKRMLNFVVEGHPLPHVEMWLGSQRTGESVPCRKVLSEAQAILANWSNYIICMMPNHKNIFRAKSLQFVRITGSIPLL